DRDHVAEGRDLTNEAAFGVAKVDVQLAAARGRIGLGHVLPKDLDRRGAFDEHRSKIANERRENIAPLERIRAAHRIRFLSERSEQAADDLRLSVERDETFLERSREPHPVVEVEQLLPR